MSALLPAEQPLRITQFTGTASARQLQDLDHLLVLVPQETGAATWRRVPDGARLRRLWQRRATADPAARVVASLVNAAATRVTLARLPARNSAYNRLQLAGELAAEAQGSQPRSIGLLVAADGDMAAAMQRALVLAVGAAAFRLPEFRRAAVRRGGPPTLRLLGLESRLDLAREQVEIETLNLVRWLTALPPNKLTATAYRELVEQLAEHHDWGLRVLDVAALRRLGAGAFLAVAQGNADEDAAILHLSRRPAGRKRPDLALVGKGIIFDTGGTNLKPFRAMLDMHQDMAGSAVALAALLAITRLRLPLAVDCWLAITENRAGPRAYKPRDIVTTANGSTIEVIHTDAEGRMALADTLALAAREKPPLIIDYATLTGQCINALTDRYSGVFTNRTALNDVLVTAGAASGERVWPFPLDEDFDDELKSTVADIAQCSVENEGDHILAARFLQRFVPAETAWVHVDLAAAARKKPLAQVPAGPTGFGVRLTLNLLLEQAEALSRVRRAGDA
jgi:leucyl aminopeptidase